MEISEAIRILGALADDKHPLTNEPLDAGSPCSQPEVQLALKRALVALEAQQKAEEAKKNRPVKAGKYWSRAEDEQVCEEVRQGMDFHQIAQKHERSVPSIVARLVKLGKIGTRANAQPSSGSTAPTKVA